MDLFNMLSDLVGGTSHHKWISATAEFTGLSVDKDNNLLKGSEGGPAFAYEIRYDASGREVRAWHMFPNGESPDPRTLAGKKMEIRYREDKPEMFEKTDQG